MTTPHKDRLENPIDVGDTIIHAYNQGVSLGTDIVTGHTKCMVKLGLYKKAPYNLVVIKKADKKDINL